MLQTLRTLFKRPSGRYLGGVLATCLAFLLREALSTVVGPDFPEFLVFYPTVMIVALLAGFWPGLFTMVTTAAVIGGVWALRERPFFHALSPGNLVGLILYMVVCTFLTVVAELYRRSRQKAAAYDREQALRERQDALRQQAELLKLSFDAIIVWRRGGAIESWNRGAEELYGFSEAEALGRDIHDVLGTADSTSWQEFEGSLHAHRQWEGELRHAAKEGREVIVSSRQHVGTGMDGRERVLEIDRDITEQKHVQEALQKAHDELEERVQQRTFDLQKANRMLMMISECDKALVQTSDVEELTAVICQIIQDEGGYPLVWVGIADGGEGAGLRRVASAGDYDGFLDGVRRRWGDEALAGGPTGEAIRSGNPVVSSDIAELDPGEPWSEAARGRGFRRMAAFPLMSAQKVAFGALVIYADTLSDLEKGQVNLLKELADDLAFGIAALRARAERDQALQALETKASQLQMLAGELVRVEQRERQRIAQLLHDQLQQLLAATLYGLESLRGARTEAEHQESHVELAKQLRECIAISRSLTSELSHPALAEPDLTAALEWLAAWMKEKHGLEVTVRSGEALTIAAEEARIMLLQAVRELLFNVVKHSGTRSALVAVALEPDGRALITVSDEGKGFDPAAMTGVRTSGGIGLFTIRERLALVGGGMDFVSTPGSGSRFHVWVPSQYVAGAPTHPPVRQRSRGERAPRVAARASRKIRILLIDDHLVVRRGIALQLRQQPDLEIVGEASNGTSGVRLARKLQPDVVTMDVNMPGMGGVEATRLIHAEFPAMRIIGLSMFDDAKQSLAMREAGAAAYLSKSASIDTLLASVRSAAGRRRAAR